MDSSASLLINPLVFFRRPDARKEGAKVRSSKLVFVVSVQFVFFIFFWASKDFWISTGVNLPADISRGDLH